MNDVATEVATETKKTRGDGLVKVAFANEKAADHKRVPDAVTAVMLNGKAYTVAAIPASVKDQLVAFAFATRAKTYVNNHADEAQKGADVPALIEKVYSDMLAGKLYSVTAEGGPKKSKEYDPSLIIQAFQKASEKRNKVDPSKPVATPEVLDKLREKIMGYEGKERAQFVLKLQNDAMIGPIYTMLKNAEKLRKAEEAAKKGDKKEDESVLDMF